MASGLPSMFGGFSKPNLFNQQAQKAFFPTIPQYVAPVAAVAATPKIDWAEEFKKQRELDRKSNTIDWSEEIRKQIDLQQQKM